MHFCAAIVQDEPTGQNAKTKAEIIRALSITSSDKGRKRPRQGSAKFLWVSVGQQGTGVYLYALLTLKNKLRSWDITSPNFSWIYYSFSCAESLEEEVSGAWSLSQPKNMGAQTQVFPHPFYEISCQALESAFLHTRQVETQVNRYWF